MRYRRKALLAAILAMTLAASGTACRGRAEAHGPVEKIDGSTLRVYNDALENLSFATASVMDFPETLPIPGKVSVTEDRTNIVPARVAGRIDSIFFASGEHVTAGKPLATLFSPDFIAAREEYLLSLRQSRAPRGKADPSDFANLTRMARKKLETMGLSSRDVDALKDDGPDDAGKSPMLLVRAPRSGVIIAKSAVLGNLVNVGDTLFMIGDLSKVWFLGDIYPEDLPRVHKGQQVRLIAPGVAKQLAGTVSFISPIVDPTSRTIKVRSLIDNSNGVLRGDEYVQASLILNERKALLVPSPAVIQTPEGNMVFKRVSPKSVESAVASVDFRRIPVKVGPEQQGMIAIDSGLSDGDEVVSDGAWLLDAALGATEKKK